MLKDDVVQYIKKHPHDLTVREVSEKFFPGKGDENYNKVSGIITRGGVRKYIKLEKRSQEATMRKVQMEAYHKRRPSKEPAVKKPNTKNILVIGDLHEPFTLDGYLAFCVKTHKKYDITHVIFIGDIIDNHFSSYHEIDPNGHGGEEELSLAVRAISKWSAAFPNADVIIGNHDRLIMRKAFTGGIPREWIKDYKDVLGTPGWNFMEEQLYDSVHFIHGEGSTARTRCRKDLMSTVQGHRHPEAYTEHVVGETFRIFGMQVGCGVDRKSYAMAYAKSHPKPAIGVGVILDHGSIAFNVLMPL